VPGLDELIAWFGYFPTFHDAEVTSILLDRLGSSRIIVHTWAMTGQVDDKGRYILRKHVMVSFVLDGIIDLNLEGFKYQNVLNSITLDGTAEGYELVLEGNYGTGGKIEAASIRIELNPGLPESSIYRS
jgi:hypothetical protein